MQSQAPNPKRFPAGRYLVAALLCLLVLAACRQVLPPSQLPEHTEATEDVSIVGSETSGTDAFDPLESEETADAEEPGLDRGEQEPDNPTPTPRPRFDYNGNGRPDWEDLAQGARQDTETVLVYDPSYVNTNLGYPDPTKGVCTDTVWRAFAAAGYDLKAMLDQDIQRDPEAYPRITKPDPHIDFRRVPNLAIFFSRYAERLTITDEDPAEWLPGDIVIYGEDQYHIGIVSDQVDDDGFPLLLHHAPEADKEMPIFEFGWVTGHYRWTARLVPEGVLIPYDLGTEG